MLYFLVHIFIHPEHAEAFHRYECHVLPIFKSYGGKVLMAFRPETKSGGESSELPHEIHLLSIPTEEAYFSYRNDPVVQEAQEERNRVIRKMEIYQSNEVIKY